MDVENLLARASDNLSVHRAFGTAYEKDGMLIIPVAIVAGGGGGGTSRPRHGNSAARPEEPAGSDATPQGADVTPQGADVTPQGAEGTDAGGGFGGVVLPAGAYVVKGDQVRWVPAVDATIVVLASLCLVRILTGAWSRRASRTRRRRLPGEQCLGHTAPPWLLRNGLLIRMTSTRMDWVAEHCQLLRSISAEFKDTLPFRGLAIGTDIHLEAKTVALILTLRDGGARVVATGNLNTTQPEALQALTAEGVTVIGGPTKDRQLHSRYLDEVIAAKPDLILDNGGDLFARYLDAPYHGLRGGTEETTSGRMRLEPLRDRLRLPILVINDSPIKQFAENEHAVGQSTLESYLRFTNRMTNGEKVTVFGYGACGRGVAANFRGAYARVTVVDVDPVTRLRAHLDGFSTPPRDAAIADADVIITVTGARDVLTAADLPLLRDGVILANAGHFPLEIDVGALVGSPDIVGVREYADDLMTLELNDGRRVHVISRGHMFNLAGPRPMGNSIESMDLGFALQARCLEAIANGSVDASSCVVPVPGGIDAAIACSYLDRKYPATPRA